MRSIILSLLLSSTSVWAGHSVNNGIDQLEKNGDAVWFVGAGRTINGCLEVAPDFGVDAVSAEQTILRAFRMWDDYFSAKRLKEVLRSRGIEFATNIQLKQGCSGGEDVAFYLGVDNPLVSKAVQDFRQPLAFAQRSSYDETTRWGKGLVWMASPSAFLKEKLDWNRDNHLLGAILHEVGHIYGCGHIRETIMRPEISEDILSPKEDWGDFLGRIDTGKQLYYCKLCGGDYNAKFIRGDVMESFLRRQFAGNVTAELTLEEDNMNLPHGTLTIKDQKRTFTVKVTARSELANAFSDTMIFHVPGDSSGGKSFSSRHGGSVYLATLEYAGRSMNVAYKRNMDISLNLKGNFVDQMLILDPLALNNILLVIEQKN